jgi:hypothetical protein
MEYILINKVIYFNFQNMTVLCDNNPKSQSDFGLLGLRGVDSFTETSHRLDFPQAERAKTTLIISTTTKD